MKHGALIRMCRACLALFALPIALMLTSAQGFAGVTVTQNTGPGATAWPAAPILSTVTNPLTLASGGVTLNNDVMLPATVIAPSGTVTLNGSARLKGAITADRVIVNRDAVLGGH